MNQAVEYTLLCSNILFFCICWHLANRVHKLEEEKNNTPEPEPINALVSFSEELHKSNHLYIELVEKYNPHKYDNEEQKKKAQDLFNELTLHQFNYNQLKSIEKKIDGSLK